MRPTLSSKNPERQFTVKATRTVRQMLCGSQIKIWNLPNHMKNETQMLCFKQVGKIKNWTADESYSGFLMWLQHFEFKCVNCKVLELSFYQTFLSSNRGFYGQMFIKWPPVSYLSTNHSINHQLCTVARLICTLRSDLKDTL